MIPLSQYARIKNNYCVAYFGACDDYLFLLEHLAPYAEKQFLGTRLFVACSDDVYRYFRDNDSFLPRSVFLDRVGNFAHIRELSGNMVSHPVYDFALESDVTIPPPEPSESHTRKCLIWTKGVLPTKNMPPELVGVYAEKASKLGYDVVVDGDPANAGWVIGVESVPLVRAAIDGRPATLIETGPGVDLFKNWFPLVSTVKIG